MKRVIAVLLVATLTTLMVGVDRQSWASQPRTTAQREEVARRLHDMHQGSTVRIERVDGTQVDAVIKEITADNVTVLVEAGGVVTTETIPIADIARIDQVSAKKMSKTKKVLIVTAVALGVLVVATVAACASSFAADRRSAQLGP
jgi:hypothetical protein